MMPLKKDDRFSPVIIENDNLSATLIRHGATLTDLRLSGVNHPLILGFDDYKNHSKHQHFYFGSVIGRFANRIAKGHCHVDGRELDLEINDGPNHLHGGQKGFATQKWKIVEQSGRRIRFAWRSPDGDCGYPGDVLIAAIYEIYDRATLRLTVIAQTDRTTPINIAHHPYFNLDDGEDIMDHKLEIAAQAYLPCDKNSLPLGPCAAVAGSAFDFQKSRSIRNAHEREEVTFNNTYCLRDAPSAEPKFAARLRGKTGVEMEVWTTQVGLHFYEGDKIENCPLGLGGREYQPYSGLCLEAQNWPDSPNHSHFPNALLHPGETYRQVTEYRFKTGI